MSWVKQYELAGSMEEAAALLGEPGWMVMGGGSHIVATKPKGIDKLVDLMLLGLDSVSKGDGELRIGARVRLEELVKRKDCEGLLEKAVLSLTHSANMRNQMTVAGETAWNSPMNELQIALLALDAVAHRHGFDPTSVEDYLAAETREGIIEEIAIPLDRSRRHHFDRIAPGDGARPLLAFAATGIFTEGKARSLRLAVGNLGPQPQRLRTVEARLEGAALTDLAKVSLSDEDRQALIAVDSPGAATANKWPWLDTLLSRSLAELACREGA